MLLAVIATSGILALYFVGTRASGFSRHTTVATVLAQDEMERLRTSSILVAVPNVTVNLNEFGAVVAGGLFTRTYTVNDGGPGPNGITDFDEMVVSVAWDDDGLTRTVTLRSRRNR